MALLQENIQFHLKVTKDQVGKYVILPGDPGRVEKIAKYLDNAEFVASNREYTTYTGYLLGEKVSVVSTGIGGPSAAIAVEELIRCGAHTFIRIGTSGGIDIKVVGGDLIVASGAIRGDGTSKEYIPEGYPAVPDFEVLAALNAAAAELSSNELGNGYHVGVVQSKDSFYGEIEPEKMPIAEHLLNRWEAYVRCGCLTSEMEAATIFSVAIARHVRAGAVFTALWNVERSKAGLPDPVCESSERAIKCSVNAIKKLIESDRLKNV
ncbi:MAG: uridine phosphorylase [Ruminiclostridium sp.]|nr:uridine phosphorylase [Ruminiclostridium sp.]MBQ8842664.1 uridine phosphorylase [Ruminiclostridium sp.]